MIRKNTNLIILFIFFSVLSVMVVGHTAKTQAVNTIKEEAERFLNIQSLNVETLTNKYGVTAALLSKRPDVINYFSQADYEDIEIGRMLVKTSQLTGAANIWGVNADGDIVVSTNENLLNLNVKDGPYFTAGMEGRLGRATIVQGINARSYVFASPIFHQNSVIGLIAVQIDLEVLEGIWAIEVNPVMAVDDSQRVFLSNINEWRFKRLTAEPKSLAEGHGLFDSQADTNNVMNLSNKIKPQLDRDYLLFNKYLPLLNWDLVLLRSYKPVKDQIKLSMAIWSLLLMFAWLIYWVLYQRTERREKERRQQIEFSHLLEKKVERRTEELVVTNIQLEQEIEERKHAEQELRKTQDELIQAAKMALIGQMSTELAHEYNQPIAAIKFYAENAEALINASQLEEVADNMSRITVLTDRMSKLTSTLRTFAHKPNAELKRINVSAVIDEVLVLMHPRAQKEQVEMELFPKEKNLFVQAGNTRLVQVITNLLSNALDALKDSQNKRLEVHWQKVDKYAEIRIKDTGSGIDPEIKDKIFEAFYTTKTSSHGLGLGLFIVYNIVKDFNGTLELEDEKGYGTVFLLKIPLDQ